ncbi:unnamed protein product [Caretta caretta]
MRRGGAIVAGSGWGWETVCKRSLAQTLSEGDIPAGASAVFDTCSRWQGRLAGVRRMPECQGQLGSSFPGGSSQLLSPVGKAFPSRLSAIPAHSFPSLSNTKLGLDSHQPPTPHRSVDYWRRIHAGVTSCGKAAAQEDDKRRISGRSWESLVVSF